MEEDALEELDERFAEMFEDQCHTGDAEIDHSEADKIVCQLLDKLGLRRARHAYDSVEKWHA